MKKTPLLLATALILTGITSIKAHATTASGYAGTGDASVTLTAGSLNFVQVPDFDFGSHPLASSLTGLDQGVPVTSNLIVDDYRGLPKDAAGSGYTVTANVVNGTKGFSGLANGGILETSDVSVALGDSEDGTLVGVPASKLDQTANTIAHGTEGTALGTEETVGGTASISIANSSVFADKYTATINYTLVAGV
ncbi:hypothetical protein [Lactococcus sp.]|uniref:hypothetical protein n=1 Tax=Lactococcus sp. TaxID=44273 RepID=UPI0035B17A0E